MGEPIVPTLGTLTISGNLTQNNTIAHVESRGTHRRGRNYQLESSTKQYHRARGVEGYTQAWKKLSAGIFHKTISSPRTWSRGVHAGVEEAAPQSILLTIKEVDEESESVCDGGDSMFLQVKVEIQELIVGGLSTATVNQQQAMDSLEMEVWRKARRTKKCKMSSPNGKLVV